MVGTEKNGSACIRCAHCRAKTRWKSGKANLKVNIALQNMVERLKKAQKQEEKERNAEERRRRRMREKEKPEKGEVNTKEEGPEAVEKEEEVVVLVVEEEEAEEDRQEAKDMADALKKAELVRSSSLLSSSSSSSSSSSAASNPSDGVPPTSPQRPTEGRRGSTAPHSPFENNGMAEEEEEEEDAIITNPDAMAAFEAALATSFTQEQQLPVLGTGAVPESFAGEHWASSGLEADGVQFQSSRERNAAKGKERSQSRHHAGNDLGWEALHRRLSRSNRDSSTINSLSRADLDNRSRSQEDRHGSSRKSGLDGSTSSLLVFRSITNQPTNQPTNQEAEHHCGVRRHSRGVLSDARGPLWTHPAGGRGNQKQDRGHFTAGCPWHLHQRKPRRRPPRSQAPRRAHS